MISLFRLRSIAPDMPRPYRTPGYPYVPAVALILSIFCLAAMAYYNWKVGLVYLGLLAMGYAWYYLFVPLATRKAAVHQEMPTL